MLSQGKIGGYRDKSKAAMTMFGMAIASHNHPRLDRQVKAFWSSSILPANQKAINGSVNITRTGTLSTWSGNCGLGELVLST